MSRTRISAAGWWILAIGAVGVSVGLFWQRKVPSSLADARVSPVTFVKPVTTVRLPLVAQASQKPPAVPEAPALSQEKLDEIFLNIQERGRIEMPLSMAEYKAGLQLTDQQQRRLVNGVVDFEHVRAQIEKALIKVKSFDGTTLALQIPAIPPRVKRSRPPFSNRW